MGTLWTKNENLKKKLNFEEKMKIKKKWNFKQKLNFEQKMKIWKKK